MKRIGFVIAFVLSACVGDQVEMADVQQQIEAPDASGNFLDPKGRGCSGSCLIAPDAGISDQCTGYWCPLEE